MRGQGSLANGQKCDSIADRQAQERKRCTERSWETVTTLYMHQLPCAQFGTYGVDSNARNAS